MWGYVVVAALVLIGTAAASATNRNNRRARGAAAGRRLRAHAAMGAFSEFLTRRNAWAAALAFVVLFKFTDAFSGTMTAPFMI